MDAGLTLQRFDPHDVVPSCRVAVLSMHTSPLEQPGAGDSGGMNIYVRKVAAEMARRGVRSDIFTRRTSASEAEVAEVAPGVRVFAVAAGPLRSVHKERLPRLVDRFVDGVARFGPYDVIHAHYWLSGVAGAKLKQRWGVPLVVSFHTLARVKDAARSGEVPEPLFRKLGEDRIVRTADRLVASTEIEHGQLVDLYGADPAAVEVVPPGVDLDVFRPGDRAAARRRFGFDAPTVVFVGRLQPLKGAHVAVAAIARLKRLVPDARLVIAGGDSPPKRGERMRLALAVRRARVVRRVDFLEPQPHDELAELYRAADVVAIPSASESFGLVALEAGACGTPVVATSVGGLRQLVHDGESGYLVPRRAAPFAYALSRVLADPATRSRLGANAVRLAEGFPWSRTVDGLLRTYRSLMACEGFTRALAASHG